MKEYFKNNILSSKDYEQALSFTFGTFYIPFLNETKYEYLQAVYNMNKCENPDTLFCPGMPELILSRLHAVCVRTLIVEMSMYKAAGKLEGGSSSKEYQFFNEQILGRKELREELFEVYPLLAENIRRTISQSADFLSEMRNRLEVDRKEIEKNILHGRTMGNITGIQDMAADCHCNGKCVLKIETDHQIKCLSEETLQEIEGNAILDHNYYIKEAQGLPSGDITGFEVKAFNHQATTMEGMMNTNYTCTIAGDEFWTIQSTCVPSMNMWLKLAFMQIRSPWKGTLSPTMFLSSLVESGGQNYTVANMYMFDETVGQFWYNNLLSANNVGVPELGTYSGYSLLFGTHTATKDHAVAVLSDGAGYRMLYMNLSNGTQSVLADFAVPSNIINETTSYYPMKNEAYMLFTTNDKLYRYNLRELENNVAPGNSSVFVELSKWGYNAEAKITCMSVSRTEQEILLGVSRYGDDTEGMSEGLKGDVLVLDLKTGELVKKYEGISGVPVDVKIKYQKWLRDGKEGGNVVDMLYF